MAKYIDILLCACKDQKARDGNLSGKATSVERVQVRRYATVFQNSGLLPWQLMSSQFTLFHACGSGKPEELPAALNDMGPEREQHLDYRCFLDGKLCLPRSTLPCMGFSTTQQRKQGPEAASQTDQRKGKYRLHVFCQQYGLQFGILSLIHLIQTNKHKCLRLPLHEDAPS